MAVGGAEVKGTMGRGGFGTKIDDDSRVLASKQTTRMRLSRKQNLKMKPQRPAARAAMMRQGGGGRRKPKVPTMTRVVSKRLAHLGMRKQKVHGTHPVRLAAPVVCNKYVMTCM